MSSTKFSSWDILDETNQLIQISDLDFNMQYANRPARNFALNTEHPFAGEKCYHYMMGLDAQCPFCPLRQLDDQDELIAEIDNGNQVFTVKTKYIEWQGQPAFIEYATSIGAVYADAPAQEFLPLLNLSDKALYQSKQAGRNRYTVQKLSEL